MWDYILVTPIIAFFALQLYRLFEKTVPNWKCDNATIPKRIFIAETDDYVKNTKNERDDLILRWQRLNPQFTVRIYTRDQCRQAVMAIGDWTVLLYDRLPTNQQLDFWRVCILFQYGGIAVHSSVIPVSQIELEPMTTFATAYVPLFLAATQANSILEHIIDYYHDRRYKIFTDNRSILADAIDFILLPICVVDDNAQTIHKYGQHVTILQTKHSLPRPWIWENSILWDCWRQSNSIFDNSGRVFIYRDVAPIPSK